MDQRTVFAAAHKLLHRSAKPQGIGADGLLFVCPVGGNDELQQGAAFGFGLKIAKDRFGRRVPFQHDTLR